MESKIIYNDDVQLMVVHIYRKNSEIFQAMTNGQIISELVKQSFKRKGSNYRIKDQKILYKLCREQEQIYRENLNIINCN